MIDEIHIRSLPFYVACLILSSIFEFDRLIVLNLFALYESIPKFV